MLRPSLSCLVGLFALACSGSYQVGEMNELSVGGSAGAGQAGGSAVGGSSSAGQPGSGGSSVGQVCGPTGKLAPVTGQLATPAVVWARIAPVMWATPHDAPQDLPASTSVAWVKSVVDAALHGGVNDVGPTFVRKWLGLPDDAPLDGDYANSLAGPWPALAELNITSLGTDGRHSPFTEPAFLTRYPDISARGAVIVRALFGQAPPPPPENTPPLMPSPDSSERSTLELTTTSPACAACHVLFDPAGFTLSHYDAVGDYRELDNGQAIDTSGSLRLPHDDYQVDFDDLPGFLNATWATCSAQLGFADNFLRIALELSGFSDAEREQLFTENQERMQEAFVSSTGPTGALSYWSLVTAYAQTPAVLKP